MTAPDPRLGEIEARLAAATPGPWVAHDLSDAVYSPDDKTGWWWVWQESKLPYYGAVMEPTDRSPNDGSIGVAAIEDNHTGVQEKADAEFIANAPADVAYLLAELRKRNDALAKVEDLAKYLDTLAHGDQHYARHIRAAAATGGGE